MLKRLYYLAPDDDVLTLKLDQTEIISNWYYFAVLEMTKLDGFGMDEKSISTELGISILEIIIIHVDLTLILLAHYFLFLI